MNPRQWFRFDAKADDPTVAEIHIIDFIGGWDDDWIARNWGYDMGVTARAFVEQLAALPAAVTTIKVHINSPGGDVFAGVNIANALREQQASKGRTVETYIDGIAASIASVIAMAGSKVHISDNALVMVHNPASWVIGNAAEMRKSADALDVVRQQIVATYQWHSEKSAEDLIALMDAETWMAADEAIANGFATDKVEGLKAVAAIDRRATASLKIPDQFKARVESLLAEAPPAPPSAPQVATAEAITRACADAGLDLAFAATLLEAGVAADALAARVTAEQTSRAAAAEAQRVAQAAADQRRTEIAALCQVAKLPTLAADFIDSQMPVDKVRHALTTIAAAVDGKEIDGGIVPSTQAAKDSWKQAFASAKQTLFAR
jgi:ATP-dependent protease ClpP protease subunit